MFLGEDPSSRWILVARAGSEVPQVAVLLGFVR